MRDRFENLQLKHFRLLREIAETGQLSIAAERLGVSQPAASRSLAEAERLIGDSIFLRQPKGMLATQIGETAIRHSIAILAQLEQASEEIRAMRSGRAGNIHVGAVTGPAIGSIVPAIGRLKSGNPDIQVRVDVAPSDELLQGLLAGELDFAAARIPSGTDMRRIEAMSGRTEALRFLASVDHPLQGKHDVSLADMAGFPWVIQASGSPIRNAVVSAHIDAGVPPPVDVIDTASILVMFSYLKESRAIAPVAAEVADLAASFGDSGFSSLGFSGEILVSPYHILRLRDRRLSPVAERLLRFVVADLSGDSRSEAYPVELDGLKNAD